MSSESTKAVGWKLGLKGLWGCGLAFLLYCSAVAAQEIDASDVQPSLNQIQVIGTHNSYHVAPTPEMMQVIRTADADLADSIDYTHLPLPRQLEQLGVRQIELDIYADPQGGLFAKPAGRQALIDSGVEPGPDPNEGGQMMQPGMKIIHSAGFDYLSTVATLEMALTQVREWSASHLRHVPVLVLLELKQSAPGPSAVKPVPFDAVQLDAVDEEIRRVFPEGQVVTPDAVRGSFHTLREAVLERGWPKLDDCRGKVLFAMDNEGELPLEYLKGHDSLSGRMMFVSVEPMHPAAAFFKLNNPIADFEKIQRLVAEGFLVRTRADGGTRQARSGDVTQRERAMASGAQFISTDYPIADPRFTEYCVQFPHGIVARSNPVNFPSASANVDENQDWDQ